jgi:GR25 family glycosyltransferase involved in LPS biosynthesis
MDRVIRWPAVDGSRLDRQALLARNLVDPEILGRYTPGALGNALSHIALWDEAIERQSAMTICEDDAIFNRGFRAASRSALEALPKTWDLILWGWNFDSHLTFEILPGVSHCSAAFDQEAMRAGVERFVSETFEPRVFRMLKACGTVCYTVSAKGAPRLRRHAVPLRPMEVHFPGLGRTLPNGAIDIVLSALYPSIEAYVSVPPLVITKNEHTISTILHPRPAGVAADADRDNATLPATA